MNGLVNGCRGGVVDDDGGLVPLPHALVRPPRSRRAPPRRWAIKETTPYRVFGPCLRSWDALFGPAGGNAMPPELPESPQQRATPQRSPQRSPPPPSPPLREDGGTVIGRVSSGRVLRLAIGAAAIGSVQGRASGGGAGGGSEDGVELREVTRRAPS